MSFSSVNVFVTGPIIISPALHGNDKRPFFAGPPAAANASLVCQPKTTSTSRPKHRSICQKEREPESPKDSGKGPSHEKDDSESVASDTETLIGKESGREGKGETSTGHQERLEPSTRKASLELTPPTHTTECPPAPNPASTGHEIVAARDAYSDKIPTRPLSMEEKEVMQYVPRSSCGSRVIDFGKKEKSLPPLPAHGVQTWHDGDYEDFMKAPLRSAPLTRGARFIETESIPKSSRSNWREASTSEYAQASQSLPANCWREPPKSAIPLLATSQQWTVDSSFPTQDKSFPRSNGQRFFDPVVRSPRAPNPCRRSVTEPPISSSRYLAPPFSADASKAQSSKIPDREANPSRVRNRRYTDCCVCLNVGDKHTRGRCEAFERHWGPTASIYKDSPFRTPERPPLPEIATGEGESRAFERHPISAGNTSGRWRWKGLRNLLNHGSSPPQETLLPNEYSSPTYQKVAETRSFYYKQANFSAPTTPLRTRDSPLRQRFGTHERDPWLQGQQVSVEKNVNYQHNEPSGRRERAQTDIPPSMSQPMSQPMPQPMTSSPLVNGLQPKAKANSYPGHNRGHSRTSILPNETTGLGVDLFGASERPNDTWSPLQEQSAGRAVQKLVPFTRVGIGPDGQKFEYTKFEEIPESLTPGRQRLNRLRTKSEASFPQRIDAQTRRAEAITAFSPMGFWKYNIEGIA